MRLLISNNNPQRLTVYISSLMKLPVQLYDGQTHTGDRFFKVVGSCGFFQKSSHFNKLVILILTHTRKPIVPGSLVLICRGSGMQMISFSINYSRVQR